MKRFISLFAALPILMSLISACNNGKTYAEMVEEEREIIAQFLADSGFYYVEGFPTDSFADPKEFMLFSDGLYMNVVEFGDGEAFKSGDEITVRYTEMNLSTLVTISNEASSMPDVFRYYTYGSYKSGTFYEDESSMLTIYSSTSVPSGWLLPLDYVRDGCYVRLIVPHDLGQTDASYYVYPCYYEIHYGISKR